VDQTLEQHIIDGRSRNNGLEFALNEATHGLTAPVAESSTPSCWNGMKVVGELFGSRPDAIAPFGAAER